VRLYCFAASATVLSLVIVPPLPALCAALVGLGRSGARALYFRGLLAFPSAALAGFLLVTLALLNYSPILGLSLGGAALFCALITWGQLALIAQTLAIPVPSPAALRHDGERVSVDGVSSFVRSTGDM
jgi:hypothetical protein